MPFCQKSMAIIILSIAKKPMGEEGPIIKDEEMTIK